MKKETRDKALQLQGFIDALTWLPLVSTEKVNDSHYHLMECLQERYNALFEMLEDE
jgi:hypothetical protein